MVFGRVSADLLSNGTDGQERESNECRLWEHAAGLVGEVVDLLENRLWVIYDRNG